VSALVVDVDGGGDVERAAMAVARYRGLVHETFSSTPTDQRCRIVLLLAEPVDVATYERLHTVVRAHLHAHSFDVDESAKDACRLSFLPVRPPGAPYAFQSVNGAPLSAASVLSAQRPTRSTWRPARIDHDDAYARGALRGAARAVAGAQEGARNATLNREAFSVARLEALDEVTIEGALLPAALAAGLPEEEARRVIARAFRARRGVL
jgi:hypothetical protein